jgi:hypothetical protein
MTLPLVRPTEERTMDIDRSNVLGDLAVRINAEHQAACAAIKSGAAHAMAAGDLLIEAKAKLDQHGAWLPWLKQNCEMSERTAQLYMRMARNRVAIEGQIRNGVADLSLRGAIDVIAPPEPGTDEWIEKQLVEPFTDFDFQAGSAWLERKIARVMQLPPEVLMYLDFVIEDDDNLVVREAPLAFCDYDDICEAIKVLVPLFKTKPNSPPPLNIKIKDIHGIEASVRIKFAVASLIGALGVEFEARNAMKTDAEFDAHVAAAVAGIDAMRANATPENAIAAAEREIAMW